MKRKLLCIAVAIIMILPLAFAAIPMASAASVKYISSDFSYPADINGIAINSDGSMGVSYGTHAENGVNSYVDFVGTANLGNSYTVEVDVRLAEQMQYAAAIGLGASDSWVGAGLVVKLGNNGNNYLELYDNALAPLTPAVASAADFNMRTYSEGFNTVKFVVENNVVDLYINDVLVLADYAMTPIGGYLALGVNGDAGNKYVPVTYKNLKVTNGEGTKSYLDQPLNWNLQDLQGIGGASDMAAADRINPSTYVLNKTNGSFGIYSNAWSGSIISSKKALDISSAITTEVVIGNMPYEATAGHGANPAQCHSIVLSASSPSIIANAFAESTVYSGIEVKFIKDVDGNIDVYFMENGALKLLSENLFVPGDVVTFAFKNNGTDIAVYAAKGNEAEALLYTYANAAGNFAGYAFLAYTAQTYGGAVTNEMTVNKVNGVAALDYAGGIVPVEVKDGWSDAFEAAFNASQNVQCGQGTVVFSANGEMNLISGDGWFGHAGTALVEKVALSGLSLVVDISGFTINEHNFVISLTKAPISAAESAGSFWSIPAYDKTATTSDLGLFFDKNGGIVTWYGRNDCAQGAFEIGEDAKFTVKFGEPYADGEKTLVKLYVNGAEIRSYDITDLLDEDGKVYLSTGVTGYGNTGCSAKVISVNGVTAGLYDGAATYTDHKATTPVVQWRAPSEKVAAGLRFKTTVALNGVNNNDSIVKMGTIIMPADKVTGGYLGHTQDGKIDGTSYLDIVAKNYHEKTDDSISFTAVLIGIPEDQLDRIFLAVSYVEYADGTITYGGLRAVSINDAMNA
ncbi:MAG: hypothetical protein IKA51_03755 [Clostridia bacterium]|nr:hypothetical protein [Clostridia bacterium]